MLSRFSAGTCWIRAGPPRPWIEGLEIERDNRMFHRCTGLQNTLIRTCLWIPNDEHAGSETQ